MSLEPAHSGGHMTPEERNRTIDSILQTETRTAAKQEEVEQLIREVQEQLDRIFEKIDGKK